MLFAAEHVLVQVWGVVGDSASNNNTAIAELAKKGYARIDGPRCQIRCFVHLLRLVSQVSLFLFPPVLVCEGYVMLSRALDEDATNSGDEDLIYDALKDDNDDLNHTNDLLIIEEDMANRVGSELQLNRVIWKVHISPFFPS